jgi:prophage regulatory protein
MLDRLRMDPGCRTLGQLIQERQWAVEEIERLRRALAEPKPVPARSVSAAIPASDSHDRLLRVSEVCEMVGLSRASVYQRVAAGTFPGSCRLGARAARWRESDISRWIDSLRSAEY